MPLGESTQMKDTAKYKTTVKVIFSEQCFNAKSICELCKYFSGH